MEILNRFPQRVTLRDGTHGILRLLEKNDTDALFQFFQSLSEDVRRFLWEDVTDRKVIEGWTQNINYNLVLPVLAEVKGKIVADATLHRRPSGPHRHVGRVRVVVHQDFLGKGLGTILTRTFIEIATEAKLKILTCMLAEEEVEAIQTLRGLGFKMAAIIPNYFMDPKGRIYNTIMMMRKLG